MEEHFQHLIFRRQFLLTPKNIETGNFFIQTNIGKGYYLHSHIDLSLTIASKGHTRLYLLGYLIGMEAEQDNQMLLDEIIDDNPDTVIMNSFKLAGRYVIVIEKDGEIIRLFNDPATARKVYFTVSGGLVWCGSQPHRLAQLLGIASDCSPEATEFFQSEIITRNCYEGVLGSTRYVGISQLPANHCLDFTSQSPVRYWPVTILEPMSVNNAAESAASILTAYIQTASNRFKLMQSLTAGIDSRILLAAGRNLQAQPYYYIAVPEGYKHSRDTIIPKKMLTDAGKEFHIEYYPSRADNMFAEVYRLNTSLSCEKQLYRIFNVYYNKFAGLVNVAGSFSEVARSPFRLSKNRLTGRELSRVYFGREFSYAVQRYDQWIADSANNFRKCNVDIMSMFYWEERMVSWGTQYQSLKDIAQEEFWPFNSRMLMEIMLSAPASSRDVDLCTLHKAVVRQLWPTLMDYPVNSPLKRHLWALFKRMHLDNLLKNLWTLKGLPLGIYKTSILKARG